MSTGEHAVVRHRGPDTNTHARRHVILPKALVKYLPKDRLANEDEWRGLGIRQRCVRLRYLIQATWSDERAVPVGNTI